MVGATQRPHLVCLYYPGFKPGCCDLPCAAPPCRESILSTFPGLSNSVLLGALSAQVQKTFRICFLKCLLLKGNLARWGALMVHWGAAWSHARQSRRTKPNSCTWNYLPVKKASSEYQENLLGFLIELSSLISVSLLTVLIQTWKQLFL